MLEFPTPVSSDTSVLFEPATDDTQLENKMTVIHVH